MTKSSSRQQILTLLASLPRETFIEAGLELERQLEPYFDETVGLFKSFKDEVDTSQVIKRFKRVLFPGADPELYARQLIDAGATKLFVPGLAFDRQRHRLGRGKGYYDRCITALPPFEKGGPGGILILGLCLKCQLVENVPFEIHDQEMDAVIAIDV
jgi:5-formyltetrahydrofolate cyclo-ligase